MNIEPVSPQVFFKEQLLQFNKRLTDINQKIRRVSVLRILSFLTTVIGIYILSGIHMIALISFALFGFTIFIMLVYHHAKLHKQKQWCVTLVQINETEIDLLKGNTANIPNGREFIDQNHPYTSDLDIFGNRSLFQLVDRSATMKGREKLAHSFKRPLKNTNE